MAEFLKSKTNVNTSMSSGKKTSDHSSTYERFTFTLPPDLVEAVEKEASKMGMNRSMVVREALAAWIAEQAAKKNMQGPGMAVITYFYSHHDASTVRSLLALQHDYEEEIISTTHMHISHDLCFETILCKGDLMKLCDLADSLRSSKGISSLNDYYAPL